MNALKVVMIIIISGLAAYLLYSMKSSLRYFLLFAAAVAGLFWAVIWLARDSEGSY